MSKMSKNLGIILGGSMGIATSWMFSAPKSPIKLKLPETEVKNVEILPNLKIRRRNHVYHVHHWVYISFFYASLFVFRKPFTGKRFIHGFVLGLIVQGLTYKDRFSLKYPHKELAAN